MKRAVNRIGRCLGGMFIAGFISIPAKSQQVKDKSFYFVFNAAYGLTGFGMENFTFPNLNYNNTGLASSSYNGNTSGTNFSRSLDFHLQAGYQLNQGIGLELGLGALTRAQCRYAIILQDSGKFSSSYAEEIQVSILRVTPAIRFELAKGRFHPYTRTGLIIGIPVLVTDKTSHVTPDSTSIKINSLSGRVSWGFLGALGCRYQLSDRISVLAELTGILESWAPRRATAKSYSVNAQDELFSLNTSQKETDYNRNYTVTNSSGGIQSPDSPTLANKRYLSFNTLEFSIGLYVTLSK